MRYPLAIIVLIILQFNVSSQSGLQVPLNIRECYQKGTRSLTGMPGSEYWQNKASYHIRVKLEPSTGLLSGSETILYHNQSPDTLNELVFTMLGDIFRRGNPNDFGIPQAILGEGIVINKLDVGERCYLDSERVQRSGTNMEIRLQDPLVPGDSTRIKIDWNYLFVPGMTVRQGNYGDSTFFIGYFYPKVAVYDDLGGWDRSQYTGYTEFFGEQSDYEVYISVPGSFRVWASGLLQNPQEVFTPSFYLKWQEAQAAQSIYRLISPDNYLDEDITQKREWNTWHFSASHIPDFAFGSSDKFLWDHVNVLVDESTGRQVSFNAAYRLDSKDYYMMADLGRKILTDFSNRVPGIPYPYPVMTIFNGNAGMEYPMMCNNESNREWSGTVGLAYHEVAHSYFPFYVGTNERKYAWMDEGWARLFPYFFMQEQLPGFDYMHRQKQSYYEMAGRENEVPIITQSDLLHERGPYRQAAYNKSFFAYLFLHEMLGEELFLEALKDYISNWAGKHPMPFDFFNSFNRVTGKDLNWFWKNWFFDRNYADLAIESFDKGWLTIFNEGKLFLPVELKLIYNNGEIKYIHRDLSIWDGSEDRFRIQIKEAEKVQRIEMGAHHIPDVFEGNNFWIK